MRKLVYNVVLALALGLIGIPASAQVAGMGANEQAQTPKERAEAATKVAIDKLIKYAQTRNYEGMGKMSAYAGRDPNRTMKSKLNMADSFERLECENTLNLIHNIVEKSVIWNPTNFRIVNAMNDKYYYWDVEFTDEKMKTTIWTMLFIELKNEMLFARIDKKGVVKTAQ